MNYNHKDLKAYSLLELGTVIQEAVKEGYTIEEGWPLQYGYWFEVRVTKTEDDVQEKPKRGPKPKEV